MWFALNARLARLSPCPSALVFSHRQTRAEGELRVKRQRQLLEDLLARGHNTARAQSLLVTMMTSLELMRKHWSLLEQDLPLDDR